MIDRNKFRAAVIEKGLSMKEVAEYLGINVSTLYRKIGGESDFTREELQILRKKMLLSDEQIMSIFFAEKLA